jgi:nitroreductase
MEIREAIEGRRSVREYEPEAIDESLIHRLIAAAVKAPSAVNRQPWTFTVVRDQELLERISRKAKAHVLATSTHDALADDFRKLLSDPDFHIFYRAPVLIVISAAAHGPWIVEDCTLAAENLMLSAFAEHLGTCWIGFAQSYLNTPKGKSVLGIPAQWVPVAPIIVGKPKMWPPSVPRKGPEIRWLG